MIDVPPVFEWLPLSEGEAMALCEALEGRSWQSGGPVSASDLLDLELQAAIQDDGVASRWAVDPVKLRLRLAVLSEEQSEAIIEAISDFWSDTSEPEAQRLLSVGLI